MTAAVRHSAEGAPEVVDTRTMRWPLFATLGAVLVGLGLCLWALSDSFEGTRAIELPRLAVPDVTTLDLASARAQLEQIGFVVDVQFQPNELKPKGSIISQKPLAGSKSEQGDRVVILASDGPLGQTVPSVTGQQAVDATAALQAVGLQVEVVPTPDEHVRVGEVLSTDPASGGRLPPSGAVKLMVSSGPAPRTVPAVLNMPIEQALAELGRSGLGVGKIDRVYRQDLAPGTVFGVDPQPGTALPRDMPVDLKVAGPEPTVAVPYLVGLQRASAEKVVKSAGLVLRVIESPVSPGDATEGKVIAQGTPPQAKVKNGSTIEITVAVAVAPVAPTTAPASPTTAPGG